jgi:hypothetical protein
MPIDLFVLSGKRQGEQIRLQQPSVMIGGEVYCDISFDVAGDPDAAEKVAELAADEYGWCIRNKGVGDWYVNQDALPPSGALPLRSGDIIRLSEMGPDLRFSIATGEQYIVEEAPDDELDSGLPNGASSSSEVARPEEHLADEGPRSNTYTVMVPLLVLVLMLLIAIVGTLLVMAD